MCANLLQSYMTLCDPVDYSPSRLLFVHGVLQARIELVAMPSCRGSSRPRNWTSISCIDRCVLYHQCHLGIPIKSVAVSRKNRYLGLQNFMFLETSFCSSILIFFKQLQAFFQLFLLATMWNFFFFSFIIPVWEVGILRHSELQS